jgi:hypothetical protein
VCGFECPVITSVVTGIKVTICTTCVKISRTSFVVVSMVLNLVGTSEIVSERGTWP